MLGRPEGPILDCLTVLRAAGVQIALDDFGTGFASLVHLPDLPATILKIDRSLIAPLPEERKSREIVGAIAALAQSLGKRVVAEGIETAAQRDWLHSVGCELGQGHLFGRAQPAVPVLREAAA